MSRRHPALRVTAPWGVGHVEVGPRPQGASPWDPHRARAQGAGSLLECSAPVTPRPRQSARATSEDGFQQPQY